MIHCGCGTKPASEDGTVLIPVLSVLLFLMLVFLGVLTYSLSRYSVYIKIRNQAAAELLAEAAVQHLLSLSADSIVWTLPEVIAPNGGRFSATSVPWGPYVMIVGKGRFANQTVTEAALVGSVPSENYSGAITVCDQRYPLMVAGNSRIVGDVYTGPSGLTSGRLEGEDIVNERFHSGSILSSSGQSIPALDNQLESAAVSLSIAPPGSQVFSGSQTWQAQVPGNIRPSTDVSIDGDLVIKDITWSVPTLTTLHVHGEVDIGGATKLSGLLRIAATGSITVRDSAHLSTVLLASSDSTVLRDNCYFSGVVIADRIVVKDTARLGYPATVSVCVDSGDSRDSVGVWLNSRSPAEASVLLSGQSALDKPPARVYVDTGTTLLGTIISGGYVELRGRLYGTVVTNDFVCERPLSTYVNWLKDCQIDRTRLIYVPAVPRLAGHRKPRIVWQGAL